MKGDDAKSRARAEGRFRSLAIGALAVLVLLLIFARPTPKAVAGVRSEEVAPAMVAPPPTPPAKVASASNPEGPPANVPPRVYTPSERLAFNQRKAAMTEAALNDVETWMKYPLWSSPLTENMQYKPPVPYHTQSAGPGDSFPKVELFPERAHYALGDVIRIVAIAWGPGGKIRFDALTATTHGAIRPRPEIDLQFVEQPDLTYVATVPITEAIGHANRGEWGILLNCEVEGQNRVGTTQFQIMATDATITGPYRVAVEDGSLSVYVGINGTVTSRQHLKGELWGPHSEAIAYAWVRNDETPVGASTMKLVFYGKTIRDSGVNGPYTIKNLVLTTFDVTNDRIENPAVDPELVTPAIAHGVFTDASINASDVTLLDKQRILQDDLEKAKHNQFDPSKMTPPPPSKAPKNVSPPQ